MRYIYCSFAQKITLHKHKKPEITTLETHFPVTGKGKLRLTTLSVFRKVRLKEWRQALPTLESFV